MNYSRGYIDKYAMLYYFIKCKTRGLKRLMITKLRLSSGRLSRRAVQAATRPIRAVSYRRETILNQRSRIPVDKCKIFRCVIC